MPALIPQEASLPTDLFNKILKGELPAAFVYRDDDVSAFMDLRPITPGHVLVVPNQHALNLEELPPDTGAKIFKVAMKIAEALRESSHRCEGVNLLLADGVAAGQSVGHLHLHVVPRYAGDGFAWNLPEDYGPKTQETLSASAKRIRAQLKLDS